MLQQVTWISTLGQMHLLFFGLIVPLLAIRSRMKIKDASLGPLDRVTHFRVTTATLLLFGGFSVLTARDQWIRLFGPRPSLSIASVGAAVAMYVVAVTLMRPRWRRAVEKRLRVVHLFMPSNRAERAWWIGVSILAGVSEEITWRGVHPILLTALVGHPLAGAMIAAATFGVAHMIQGWKSAAIIMVFALGFQTIVWLSGSLYLAMLVHLAYDITAGLAYGRLGRELGYALENQTVAT